MEARLDTKRPCGTVHGTGDGRFYVQDGKFFHKDGTPWEGAPDAPAIEDTPEFKAALAKAAPAVPLTQTDEFRAAVQAEVAAAVAAALAPKPAEPEKQQAPAPKRS